MACRRSPNTTTPPGLPDGVSTRPLPTPHTLVDHRRDDVGEVVARPVQAALHRTQVAAGDVGDLLVRLALHLTENEDDPVVLRQLRDGLLDLGDNLGRTNTVITTGVYAARSGSTGEH